MQTYGFYSYKKEENVGYLTARNINSRIVRVTEICDFNTEEEALEFLEKKKVYLPDTIFRGVVTDVVRITNGDSPFKGKEAIVRTLLMGKRVDYTSKVCINDPKKLPNGDFQISSLPKTGKNKNYSPMSSFNAEDWELFSKFLADNKN